MGGAYFYNLIGGFTEKGILPVCVELGKSNPPKWLAEFPQAKYFALGIESRIKYPLAVARLVRILRREKIDILQNQLYDAGLIGLAAGRIARVPLVITTRHHSDLVKMLGTKYHVMLDRLMADKADAAIVVSDAVRRFMQESDRIKQKRIKTIYIGFDFEKLSVTPEQREKVRKEFDFAPDSFVIGYVGQIIKGKGHLQLLEAFKDVADKIPEAKLFFVGSGDTNEIRRKIAEYKLAEKVILAGWRDDAAACIGAMDVFVQPSLSEAFSQVIIEAMAIGTPLVATTVGGAAEVITNEINGLLIPPDNIPAISKAVLKMYNDKNLREKTAANAQAHVRREFTVEKMVGEHIDCYEKWLDQKNGR